MSTLSSSQLDYLTDIDHRDHEALVALDPGGESLIGVARYVRIAPTVAEPALAVADDWQGRGVGSALLERLVDRALEEGIDSFVGSVLADNSAPLRLLGQAGDVTVRSGGPVSEVEVALRDATPPTMSPLRTILRGMASGTLEPALRWWQRLLPRPRGRLDVPRADVIVAAVGSAESGDRMPAALSVAAELAAASGSVVALVGSRGLGARSSGADARLERLAEALEAAGTTATATVRAGDLAAAVLDVAAEQRARLIVVEDPGEEGGRLVGPPWDHISHHAPCNVLIARRSESAEDDD